MSYSSTSRNAILALLLLAATLPGLAAEPVNTGRVGDVAIHGYDPVAYFEQSQAVEGDGSITYRWNDATWRFASSEHRELFVAEPEKYAPQFGGYCAFGVSKGALAKIDPDAWSVVDGKLYLNYNKKIQKKWEGDIPGYLAKAAEHWPRLAAD